jgi:hypothetical protein
MTPYIMLRCAAECDAVADGLSDPEVRWAVIELAREFRRAALSAEGADHLRSPDSEADAPEGPGPDSPISDP